MVTMRRLARTFRGQRSVSDAFLVFCRAQEQTERCLALADHAQEAASAVGAGKPLSSGTAAYCEYHAMREFMWACLDSAGSVRYR